MQVEQGRWPAVGLCPHKNSCSRLLRVGRTRCSKPDPQWQEILVHKIEDRREYLTKKWNKTNLAYGLSKGHEVLLDGWRSTELGRTVDKDLESLQEKWRKADKGELNQWQNPIKNALKWTAIFGPLLATLAVGLLGLTATVVAGMTVILFFIPYAVIMGRSMDVSAFYAAFQIALIQLFTIFSWLVYAGAEWTMTWNLSEEEKSRYLEDQELKRLQIQELDDFDLKLISNELRKDKFRNPED